MKQLLIVLFPLIALSSCEKDFTGNISTTAKSTIPVLGSTPSKIHFRIDQLGFDQFVISSTAIEKEYSLGFTKLETGVFSAHGTTSTDIFTLIGGDVEDNEPFVAGSILIQVQRNPATYTDDKQGNKKEAKGTGKWYIKEATGSYSNIVGGEGTLTYKEIYKDEWQAAAPIFTMDMEGHLKTK